ncbi:MAG: hypothetical protein ACFHWX_09100 [Bacteroidota bacterium]
MKVPLAIKKHTLRLILGILALILPIAMPLGRLVFGGSPILQSSISAYYFSEVRFLFLIILTLFGLAFIFYGLTYSRQRWILILTGTLTICVAYFPTSGPGVSHSWISYFHIICAVGFFFMLGFVIRYSFNLPLAFPLLTKLGLYIWIAEGVLIIYFLAFRGLWPPLVFFLETVILWLFTFGVYVRWQIDKRLRG